MDYKMGIYCDNWSDDCTVDCEEKMKIKCPVCNIEFLPGEAKAIVHGRFTQSNDFIYHFEECVKCPPYYVHYGKCRDTITREK